MRAHYSYLKGDNVAVAQCPASCGELIQGWILGSEKLVSCPVDWYSTVAVTAAPPLVNERPLSRAMVERVLAHWQYPAHWSNEIRVDVRSSIPVAKGMASSTADIAATAVATAHHLGHSLDETTLAQLCVSIEPTDSTVFHQLTLFDHNNAATQIACEPPPPIDLLVLESPVTLRTQDYHRLPRQQKLIASSPTLQQAWNLVQEACITQNPLRLGEAATLSAIASQTLLPKPGFTALLSLVEECDLYGLNVAHSGSVVGLMLDRKRHDIARLKGKLAEKKLTRHWPKQHLLKMVTGGVKLQREPDIRSHCRSALFGFYIGVFHFAHRFQLFGNVATLFGDFGIFNDVVINAIFIVAFHAGDDTLNRLNAHTWLDVVAQVVQQQHTLLVVTDLLLNVLNFTLQFIFATEQTNKLQHVLERRLGCFHFYTPDNVRFGFVKQLLVDKHYVYPRHTSSRQRKHRYVAACGNLKVRG